MLPASTAAGCGFRYGYSWLLSAARLNRRYKSHRPNLFRSEALPDCGTDGRLCDPANPNPGTARMRDAIAGHASLPGSTAPAPLHRSTCRQDALWDIQDRAEHKLLPT